MRIFCWNIRGLAKKEGRVQFFKSLYMLSPDIFALIETHINADATNNFLRKLSPEWHGTSVPGTGAAGGIMLCWKPMVVRLTVIQATGQIIHAIATDSAVMDVGGEQSESAAAGNTLDTGCDELVEYLETITISTEDTLGAPGASFQDDLVNAIMNSSTSEGQEFSRAALVNFFRELYKRAASKPIQIVDSHGTFNEKNMDNFDKFAMQSSDRADNFATVSIIGPQSSGKSYLMNKLFETKFEVMDDSIFFRRQTTKGIWISRCLKPCALIIDVEGADGEEKGEADVSFEKRAALFALTVSDLMIFNMWYHDIGRIQGGCVPLLKTVFEERVKLDPGKTKMLVVLRDCDKQKGISKFDDYVNNAIKGHMEKLWNEVHHDQPGQSPKFSDFIEVEAAVLPPKCQNKEFMAEVTKLKEWFAEQKLVGKRQDSVSTSGFSISAKRIWETIKENKRLDLPSNKVIVSDYFCQKTVKETLATLVLNKDYCSLDEAKSLDDFTGTLDSLLGYILTRFDKETEQYGKDHRASGREALEKEILQRAVPFAQKVLSLHHYKALCEFENKIAAEFGSLDDPRGKSDTFVKRDLQSFTEACKGLSSRYKDLCSDSCDMLEGELRCCAEATVLSIELKNLKKKLKEVEQDQATIARQLEEMERTKRIAAAEAEETAAQEKAKAELKAKDDRKKSEWESASAKSERMKMIFSRLNKLIAYALDDKSGFMALVRKIRSFFETEKVASSDPSS